MMLHAFKDFQLQRLEDLTTLSAIATQAWSARQFPALDTVPESAQYTAVGSAIMVPLVLILLSPSGRRAIFLTVDTVLAVLLIAVLLAGILALPAGAVYIGVRGSILMARSLADNFPAAALLLRPLLAALGQAAARTGGDPAAAAAAAAGAGSGGVDAAAAGTR